jgi:hypothetical protein
MKAVGGPADDHAGGGPAGDDLHRCRVLARVHEGQTEVLRLGEEIPDPPAGKGP